MKEYLVHIEIEDKDNSHKLIFRSSTLTVLFLAIDDFRKAISNVLASDTSIMIDAQTVLETMSNNFERQLTTVDEQDQFDEQQKASPIMQNFKAQKDNVNDEQQEENSFARGIQEPQLKIAFPGAEWVHSKQKDFLLFFHFRPNPYEAALNEFIVKPKKQNPHHRQHNPRQSTSDINDNDLVREMRQKLKGRNLRDVVIDGANIGRTYEFNSYFNF